MSVLGAVAVVVTVVAGCLSLRGRRGRGERETGVSQESRLIRDVVIDRTRAFRPGEPTRADFISALTRSRRRLDHGRRINYAVSVVVTVLNNVRSTYSVP